MRMSSSDLGRLLVAKTLVLIFWVDQVNGLKLPTSSALLDDDPQKYPTSVLTVPPELRRRQQNPIATCGYLNGDAQSPVTCRGSSQYCAVSSTYVGCCTSSNCVNIRTTCYDALGAVCDQACQANTQNLICPSDSPYCALFNYEGGSVGFGCATFPGQTTTVLLNPVATPSSLTTPTPSASPASTVTVSPASASATASSSSSGLSGAAIGGIVVGVVLGVAIAAAAAWFFLRKKRHNKDESEIATPTPKPMRESQITELSSDNNSQQRWTQMSDPSYPSNQSNQSNPSSQSWALEHPALSVPDHHGREFSPLLPETVNEMPDSSTSNIFPSANNRGTPPR